MWTVRVSTSIYVHLYSSNFFSSHLKSCTCVFIVDYHVLDCVRCCSYANIQIEPFVLYIWASYFIRWHFVCVDVDIQVNFMSSKLCRIALFKRIEGKKWLKVVHLLFQITHFLVWCVRVCDNNKPLKSIDLIFIFGWKFNQ